MILVDFDEDGTKLKVRYEITPPLLTLVSKYVFLFSGPLITERTKRAKAVLSGTRRFSGCKYLGSCSTMHTSVELVRYGNTGCEVFKGGGGDYFHLLRKKISQIKIIA